MKDKMIDAIFNHISDYANYGGDAQKAAIFRAGFYALSVGGAYTPDGDASAGKTGGDAGGAGG